MAWTTAGIPDQTGRTAVITGASSGIGETAAAALAARGARVIMAVRNPAKAEAVRARILARHPGADLVVSQVDMADLASVRAFAERANAAGEAVDMLINNAGLGMQPKRAVTVDGYERQFETNYLAAFALTGLLLPSLLKAPAPRVVAVSSIAHRHAKIDFDDLQGQRRYSGMKAYNQSKLADLMFALELDRRARAAGSPLVSVAAHPGVSSTGFFAAIGYPKVVEALAGAVIGVVGQDATRGSWPLVYAATMPDVRGGQYWGPNGLRELRGPPAPAAVASQARDAAVVARLWSESERLTGITFGPLGGAGSASAA